MAGSRFKSGFGAVFVLRAGGSSQQAGSGPLASLFGFPGFGPVAGVAGTTPYEGAGDPSKRSFFERVTRSATAPLIWIEDLAGGFGLLLAFLVVAAVALLGISALPPRLVRWTPLPVGRFVASRSYVAVLALSLLAGAALVYTLGVLHF